MCLPCSSFFFFPRVCIVRVKTRSPILRGNDPGSPVSCLHCSKTLLCIILTVFYKCPPQCLCSGAEPRVVLCQLPPRVPVKHSLSGASRPTQRAALGTNQAENPLIPVVTVRHGMLAPRKTLGGALGGEEASSGDAAGRLKDFKSRSCVAGEQSRGCDP